ncbi:gamma carbonic anhydrase family protein [Petrotoga sp. 9PWA.NaAc.5.4]|uniref:gamma carbonic anhydrase family protein n=1 Tax=Petrotoga sp. 9PWA.NaAc.5.4 TaxID=1434328 RepID=UPI000CB7C63E|nr:gamma carbonic anhydrase family protein [Petrotoga sp. 9PWA.NaAc.5.4]PNR92303.1 hypothetical protein X924_09970 [Petrotoga sp. 9PWA.NaAc.5.4]
MIHKFNDITPEISEDVFLAPDCQIIGNVKIGKGSSIWFNTTLRGDIGPINIGEYTNIQDNSVVHIDSNFPVIIGNRVTVGHNAIIHGCEIADNCLIGMGAIILNGAKIGESCLIGAGTLITENKIIPPYSLVIGVPGRIVRNLTEEEIEKLKNSAKEYYNLSKKYLLK